MEKIEASGNQGFKFKMEKIERSFSIIITIIFFLSFKSTLMTVLLYAIALIVLPYYFIWYRKKSDYISIGENEMTVYPPLLFKPLNIKKEEISQIKVLDNQIKIDFEAGGIKRGVSVYSKLLDQIDWEKLTPIMKGFKK